MLSKTNILAISLVAMFTAMSANAQIASKAYVDDVVPTATSELTNDSGFITSVPAATSSVAGVAQLASGSTNTTAENVSNKVTENDATNLTNDQKSSTTLYPSMATANAMLNANLGELTAAVSGKVAKNQGSGNANKALITNNSGTVTTGTITSGMISDGTIADADIATDAAIAKTKLASGVQTSLGYADDWNTTKATYGDVVTHNASEFAAASHNQASNTINAMTGYEKAATAAAIGTSDSLNTAIGKLEKALDGKQNTIAANTYDAYGAASGVQTAIEGKLDDGASGYDIDAKTLKVQGADVLTSHQDISGKQDIQIGAAGDAGKAVVVASDGKIGMSTNTLGSAAWANAGGSVASGNTGLVTGGTVYTALADKVDTTKVADANGVMVRNTAGTAMKATGTDITVNNGALTVNHATSANSIPNGSENATSYASVWVE